MRAPDEKSIISRFIDHSENTMNSSLNASVGIFLKLLQARYSIPATGAVTAEPFEQALAGFEAYLKDKKPECLSQFDLLKSKMDQACNELDTITLYEATHEDEEKTSYKTKRTVFPLKCVFTLVYRALTDRSAYPKAEQDNKSLDQRLETLANTVRDLRIDECHTGVRNDIVMTLNGVFTKPANINEPLTRVMLIEDLDAFILSVATETVESLLDQIKKESSDRFYTILTRWLLTGDMPNEPSVPSNILAFLEANLRELLRKKLLNNGINPDDKNAETKIDNLMAFLDQLSPPLGNDVFLHNVNELMMQLSQCELNKKTNNYSETRHTALITLAEKLKTAESPYELRHTLAETLLVNRCMVQLTEVNLQSLNNEKLIQVITSFGQDVLNAIRITGDEYLFSKIRIRGSTYDKNYGTLAHTACFYGRLEVIQLLAAGADLDLVRKDGRSSLSLAQTNKNYPLVALLIIYGASIDRADKIAFSRRID